MRALALRIAVAAGLAGLAFVTWRALDLPRSARDAPHPTPPTVMTRSAPADAASGSGAADEAEAEAVAATIDDADIAGEPLVVELVEPPAARYGAPTWTEADRKYASLVEGIDRASYDPTLGHAARELAAFYALAGKLAPTGALSFFLNSAGAAEWDVLRTMMVTSDTSDEAVRKRVADVVGREDGPVRVGVGEAYPFVTPARRYVSVLVSRRELVLDRVSRSVRPGTSVSVSGRLPDDARSPRMLVMGPDLDVREIEVVADGRTFRADVPVGVERGVVQIEVVAERATGPHPLAQLELYVGQPSPKRWVGRWAPDETGLKTYAEAREHALALLNADRVAYGLNALKPSRELTAVAQAHSRDMADAGFVGHRSPTTGLPSDRVRSAGVDVAIVAENIAVNTSLADAEAGLMHSLGHRKNILAPWAREVGIGVVARERPGGGREWLLTQLMAARR